MISFNCPCGKTVQAPDERAADSMFCPVCGRAVLPPVAGPVGGEAPVVRDRITDATQPFNPLRLPTEVDRFTDKVPVTRFDAAAPDLRSAGGGCPHCGASEFTRVKPIKGAVVTIDRQCKACGTCYLTIPAPVSGAVQAAMFTSGLVVILGGILAVVLQLAAMPEEGLPRTTSFQWYGVIFSFVAGFGMIRTPNKLQQQREKRWQDYKAAAPPNSPPPVEISRQPDAVFISILFGAMSLAAPLVSALLTVVVFGPAAIVCGAVALLQGHVKGLIGFLLGAAGLIIWGLAFFFIIQHGI